MNNNSKFILIKTTSMGLTSFKLILNNNTVSIAGCKTFSNAFIINEDLVAVAVMDTSHKTIKAHWYAINSNGSIVMSSKSKDKIKEFAISKDNSVACAF